MGTETPGLGGIRSGIKNEPEPRNPFAVDEGNALEALRRDWGGDYALKVRNGTWEAAHRQRPHVTLEAPTPDGLYQLLLEDSRSC